LAELNAIWPMTSLLDMVKETDLRLGFTDVLKSPTAYEVLERSELQPRLLLCLHGIGTNAGDTACPQSGNLGHRHNSMRIGFQTLRCLGSESHHPVACPLRRARHHDLLIASSRLVD
jgi:hypothetical protein